MELFISTKRGLDTEDALELFNKLQTRKADFLSASPGVEFRDA
jgi:hypothetical protein